ncbi:hypothetical protein BHE74_00032382 [Ensete ventricosum]|nr:hypothetical protein GW17_00020894 [Ensete ventricosum]RWW60615.1 hypothetical protein BHE74_00032382 [Ensete ventricosum]
MVFVRKTSFKLRVMRLNRVELFYALVVAIDNKSRHCLRGRGGHMHVVYMQRWLAMVRPPAWVNGHGLATCKGRPAVARPLARGDRQWPACKGQTASASPTASKGGDAGRRSGRPLAARLPVAKGNRRLRRGNGSDGVVWVKEG